MRTGFQKEMNLMMAPASENNTVETVRFLEDDAKCDILFEKNEEWTMY